MGVQLFHQFAPQVDPGFDPTKVREGEPVTRTKQAFKKECDINFIVSQYERTGEFPYVNPAEQAFGDVTGLEFRAMVDTVNAAKDAFAALPAEIRTRFGNDPREFVDFCSDEQNKDELVRLGLAAKPSVEDPLDKVVTKRDLEEVFARQKPAPETPVVKG